MHSVYLRALRRTGLLPRIEATTRVIHDGRSIAVPVVAGVGLQHLELTESHIAPALRAGLASRSGLFVDVGAHFGETLMKVLAFGGGLRYLGFEPNLRAAAYVQRLLVANGQVGNVVPAALGDRCGSVDLLLSDEADSGATIVPEFRDGSHYRMRRRVALLRGDEAVGSDPVGILKIDAEGAELDVLRGFGQTIQRDRPIVHCEILPASEIAGAVGRFRRERSAALMALVAEHGYEVLAVEKDGSLAPAHGGELPGPDHVLVPAEDKDDFMATAGAFRSTPQARA